MACVGGGIDVDWLVLAAACCVRGLVSGGGRGGGGVGVALLVVGGLGWVGLDSPDLKNATDPSR